MRLIAKTLPGLEPILAEELKQIGAENINPVTRGVTFEGFRDGHLVKDRRNKAPEDALAMLKAEALPA